MMTMKKRLILVALLSLAVIVCVALDSAATRQRPIGDAPAIAPPEAAAVREYVLIFRREGTPLHFSLVMTGATLDAAMHEWISVRSLDASTPDRPVNYVAVEVQ